MTDGEPETVVSASLQKIKSIKNPIKLSSFFIKSETSDSFVNHFDGHFAYLKTLDFYFNVTAPFFFVAYRFRLGFGIALLEPPLKADVFQCCLIYIHRDGPFDC